MSVITREQLENASLDADTLSDVVNGAADLNGTGTVESRLGETLKTLAKIQEEIEAGTLVFNDGGNLRLETPVVSQRNGLGTCSHYLHLTYTDGSNYERMAILAAAGSSGIYMQHGGTGVQRGFTIDAASITLMTAGAQSLIFTSNVFYTGSSSTIGNSANKWPEGHFQSLFASVKLQLEQAAAPSLSSGQAVLWIANGAGTKDGTAYDQGDVMVSSLEGVTAKTVKLLDLV